MAKLENIFSGLWGWEDFPGSKFPSKNRKKKIVTTVANKVYFFFTQCTVKQLLRLQIATCNKICFLRMHRLVQTAWFACRFVILNVLGKIGNYRRRYGHLWFACLKWSQTEQGQIVATALRLLFCIEPSQQRACKVWDSLRKYWTNAMLFFKQFLLTKQVIICS